LFGVAVLAGSQVPSTARAAIPYDMQLTPGQLRGIAYSAGDPWLYGYWEYLPANYEEYAEGSMPLLMFLPGIGEYDNISSCPGGADLCSPADCGGDGLCRNLTWGPQDLIQAGRWDDVQRPFIMVSPQHPVPTGSTGQWDVNRLDDFVQFVVDNYPVDQRRMYIIGMSQGGRGTLQYTQAYPRRFTAVAPAPGGSVDLYATCYYQDTGLWLFHGENDADGNLGPGVFNPCTMVNLAYQYENPELYIGSPQCVSIAGDPRPPGRMTMFHGVGHFAWVETVDPVFEGFPASEWAADEGCAIPATFRAYEAALDPDGVYSWFLSLDRPMVVAPDDFVHDQLDASLTAVVTDDDAVTYAWTQTAGPAAILSNIDTDTLDVSDLLPSEQYTFQVYVVDDDGQWDVDEVIVSTAEMLGGGEESSSGGEGSSSSGGGEATTGSDATEGLTTGGGEGPGSEGGSLTSTSAGGGDSTGAEGGPLDDTGGPGGEGSGGLATSAAPGGSSDETGGGPPGVDDGGAGCGCTTDRPVPGGWWAWAVVVAAIRRRRSAATRAR